jgi:metal-responsive CopG/Arc/MetJ family transcriptional regulator
VNTATLHIRIDPELLDDFKKAAKEEHRMVSEIVREMVVKYLRDRRIDKSVKRLSNNGD